MSIIATITGRANRGPIPVATPEWPELDGQLGTRRLSPAERLEFYAAAGRQQALSGPRFQTFLTIYCTVLVADGSRAFADADVDGLVADPGSGSAVERLSDQADEINWLSTAARETLKKTCETAPDSASSSASPASAASP